MHRESAGVDLQRPPVAVKIPRLSLDTPVATTKGRSEETPLKLPAPLAREAAVAQALASKPPLSRRVAES